MLRMLPSWPNAHYILSGVLARKPNTNFFRHEGSLWTTPGFPALQYRMFWEFTRPRNENQASLQKNTKCGPTSSYTDRRNQLQKCILATDSCSFRHELPMSYMVETVTILWLFVQTFSKYSSPEMTNFLRHLPEHSHLKYSCINNTRCSTVHLSRGVLLHQWKAAMYLLAAKVTMPEGLHSHLLRRDLWPYIPLTKHVVTFICGEV